eukprot:9051864-Alexandrium_andersonii.AAC.1
MANSSHAQGWTHPTKARSGPPMPTPNGHCAMGEDAFAQHALRRWEAQCPKSVCRNAVARGSEAAVSGPE